MSGAALPSDQALKQYSMSRQAGSFNRVALDPARPDWRKRLLMHHRTQAVLRVMVVVRRPLQTSCFHHCRCRQNIGLPPAAQPPLTAFSGLFALSALVSCSILQPIP